jgi:hypothetical protein
LVTGASVLFPRLARAVLDIFLSAIADSFHISLEFKCISLKPG